MGNSKDNKKNTESAASEQSAALFVTQDDSLASLLLNHGIKVRDFVLLSFLADQGSMDIAQLANIVGIDTDRAIKSLQRLSAVGLAIRDPIYDDTTSKQMAKITTYGQDIARRVNDQD